METMSWMRPSLPDYRCRGQASALGLVLNQGFNYRLEASSIKSESGDAIGIDPSIAFALPTSDLCPGSHQGLKKTPLDGIPIVEKFRVPLDSQDKRAVRGFDGFNHTVRGDGGLREVG